jgi:hypothetical protein
MKLNFLIIPMLIFSILSCTSSDKVLIQNKTSEYSILIPDNADSLEMKAAEELQYYLKKISDVQIPILDKKVDESGPCIYIGNFENSQADNLKPEEVVITVSENDILIYGGNSRSTLYAVYTFVENYLGCRFYSPKVEFVPVMDKVFIPASLEYRYIPPVTTRTVHSKLYYENHIFADKRKTTYEAFPQYVPSARVHTFHRFMPADMYYASHPEYYALRSGRRITTQLCLTNPDVLRIVTEKVASMLEEFPEADVISVSQDDNQQYCECENCRAIDEREGSPSGTMIDFVNKVAEQFPDKMISTLAYQYTRKAPKNIKPAENVLITLCSIECDRSAPIDEKCTDFAEDLVAWGKLTDNVRIWDYTTQFTNFLAPFPNIFTLQPNIQLFRNNNAKWIFEQHSHNPSELFELRSYLTAKLLWDPEVDQDSIMTDFLNGYYEEAAPFVQNYISTIHEELEKDPDFFLFLYGDPAQGFQSFLRPELLKQYDIWYAEATEAVAGKPEVLKRVNRARLSVDYAILEAARLNDPDSYMLAIIDDNGIKSASPDLVERLNRFRMTCQEGSITYMNEMRYSVEDYLEFYEYTLLRAKEENIAIGKEVELLQQPKKYADEDPQTLTDGAFGGSNFYANWLGFDGNDLEAIIDLNEVSDISHLSCDFLQVVNHIVFFPLNVTYYYSIDGKQFYELGSVNNKRPLSKQSKINDIQSFSIDFDPVKARYVKILGNNMEITPDWHHGAGLSCWIFADEVTIR